MDKKFSAEKESNNNEQPSTDKQSEQSENGHIPSTITPPIQQLHPNVPPNRGRASAQMATASMPSQEEGSSMESNSKNKNSKKKKKHKHSPGGSPHQKSPRAMTPLNIPTPPLPPTMPNFANTIDPLTGKPKKAMFVFMNVPPPVQQPVLTQEMMALMIQAMNTPSKKKKQRKKKKKDANSSNDSNSSNSSKDSKDSKENKENKENKEDKEDEEDKSDRELVDELPLAFDRRPPTPVAPQHKPKPPPIVPIAATASGKPCTPQVIVISGPVGLPIIVPIDMKNEKGEIPIGAPMISPPPPNPLAGCLSKIPEGIKFTPLTAIAKNNLNQALYPLSSVPGVLTSILDGVSAFVAMDGPQGLSHKVDEAKPDLKDNMGDTIPVTGYIQLNPGGLPLFTRISPDAKPPFAPLTSSIGLLVRDRESGKSFFVAIDVRSVGPQLWAKNPVESKKYEPRKISGLIILKESGIPEYVPGIPPNVIRPLGFVMANPMGLPIFLPNKNSFEPDAGSFVGFAKEEQSNNDYKSVGEEFADAPSRPDNEKPKDKKKVPPPVSSAIKSKMITAPKSIIVKTPTKDECEAMMDQGITAQAKAEAEMAIADKKAEEEVKKKRGDKEDINKLLQDRVQAFSALKSEKK